MSFPTVDPAYGYGVWPNVCPTCFPINETPDPVFMCIGGIERSPLAGGGDPPAPNGIYELPPTGPCVFFANINNYLFQYTTGIGLSDIHVDHVGGPTYFFATDNAACAPWMANLYINPAVRKFINGWATIVHPMAEGMIPVPDIMALVNLHPHHRMYCSPNPGANGTIVYRFSRRVGRTNIRISVDHS